jgi:hypothetical protein
MKTLTTQESQIATMICSKAGIPIFMHSHQGVGKTSLVKQLHRHIQKTNPDFGLVDIRLSQIEGIDIRGLMQIVDGRTVYCPPSYLPTDLDKRLIVFFDEVLLGEPDALKAVMQWVCEGKVGDHLLSPHTTFIGASNRSKDEAMNTRMSGPMANRWCHIEVDNDLDEWIRISRNGFQNNGEYLPDWDALPETLGRECGIDLDGRIMFFIKHQDRDDNPVWRNFDKSRFRNGDYAHATMRSWHDVSRILTVLERDEDIWNQIPTIKKIRRALVCGLVGDGVGTSLTGLIDQLDKLVDIEDVKKRGDKAKLPDKNDPMCLGITWISVGALTNQRHFNCDTADNILRYINKLGEEISPDLPKTTQSLIENAGNADVLAACEQSKEYHTLIAA